MESWSLFLTETSLVTFHLFHSSSNVPESWHRLQPTSLTSLLGAVPIAKRTHEEPSILRLVVQPCPQTQTVQQCSLINLLKEFKPYFGLDLLSTPGLAKFFFLGKYWQSLLSLSVTVWHGVSYYQKWDREKHDRWNENHVLTINPCFSTKTIKKCYITKR